MAKVPRSAVTAAVIGLIVAGVAGCGPSGGAGSRAVAGSAISYWTKSHLLDALPFGTVVRRAVSRGTSHPAAATKGALRVGALFDHDKNGDHFCTASVVDSPGRDLILTAAHCVNGGNGTGNRGDLVFVPGYRNGIAPDGVWTPRQVFISPGWTQSKNSDLDVAFITLEPLDGKNIQDVLGGNRIAFNTGYRHLVQITGYPGTSKVPITCQNWSTEQSPTQLRVVCASLTDGVSGSPWVTRVDEAKRRGTVIGTLGGYQEGGDTADVSYAAYFGDSVKALYQEAIAAG